MENQPPSRALECGPTAPAERSRYGGQRYQDAGIVYVCYGRDDFFAEAEASIRSVRAQMPDVRISVYCDRPDMLANVAVDVHPLDGGIDPDLRRAPFFLKPLNLQRSPYRRTLYLDGDTHAVLPFWEIFDVLDRFDVAGCIEGSIESRSVASEANGWTLGLSFPEWNLGVLGYRRGSAVTQLFADWIREYERQYFSPSRGSILSWNDQVPFRVAAWNGTARLLTLPNNYNAKVGPFESSSIQNQVKILHGRHPDLSQVAQQINRRLTRRVLSGAPRVPLLSLRNGQVSHLTVVNQEMPEADPAKSP